MERGRTYGAFTARYGERVEVYGSSSATEPQVWLKVNTATNKNDYLGGERTEAEALLSLAQAKVLRAVLYSFIADAEREADRD